ncbi:MAG: orc1/cdc6 family replication initiation protein [Thaumarchaeota archaeon]|nr:orc1/cdc6 family replication initiation protein [Nitrososphaerota archaeon]
MCGLLRFEAELKEGKLVTVVPDEINQLTDQRILYDPLRNGCGFVRIANDEGALMSLDPGIRSSLQLEEIAFSGFTGTGELYKVYHSRVESPVTERACR